MVKATSLEEISNLLMHGLILIVNYISHMRINSHYIFQNHMLFDILCTINRSVFNGINIVLIL